MPDKPTSLEYLKQEKQIVDDLQQQLQPEVPEPITSFLGRLALLYGMPFGNLVPDARMLPPESIRFFYIDRNWVEALVDGAFSIGVHSERDIRYHKVMQHAVREASAEASGALRSDLRGEADLIIKRLSDDNDARRLEKALSDLEGVLEAQVTFADKKARVKYVPTIVTQANLRRAVSSAGFEAVEPNQGEDPPIRAGFLMRSAIVSGWPGLEICGYSTAEENDKTKLKLLRLERLSPDVLLCIFEDIPKMIVINEPAEDFHFGVTAPVMLREPVTGKRLTLPSGKDCKLPMREKEGVINIEALNTKIRTTLDSLNHSIGQGNSNFAVQMIDAADKQAFIAMDGSEA